MIVTGDTVLGDMGMLQGTWLKGNEHGQKQLRGGWCLYILFFFCGILTAQNIQEGLQYAVNSTKYSIIYWLLPSANTEGVRRYNGVHDLLFTGVWGQSEGKLERCRAELVLWPSGNQISICSGKFFPKLQNVRQNLHCKLPWGKESA